MTGGVPDPELSRRIGVARARLSALLEWWAREASTDEHARDLLRKGAILARLLAHAEAHLGENEGTEGLVLLVRMTEELIHDLERMGSNAAAAGPVLAAPTIAEVSARAERLGLQLAGELGDAVRGDPATEYARSAALPSEPDRSLPDERRREELGRWLRERQERDHQAREEPAREFSERKRQSHDERTADLALADHGALLPRSALLETSALYTLTFRIGAPYARSLLVEPSPDVDELLAPLTTERERQRGLRLHIVCFGLSFGVTRQVFALLLPERGPTEEASFEIQAPHQPGPARLRLAVYYRDHLVQSYLVDAEVVERGRPCRGQDASLTAHLEYSRAPALEGPRLNRLAPRVLSLGRNQGPGATHTLTIKSGLEAADVHFTEEQMKSAVAAFRDTLRRATADDHGRPIFPTEPQGPERAPERFDAVVRELAVRGRALYEKLFRDAPAGVQRALLRLSRAGGEGSTIQIVRQDPNHAFPWSGLYAYATPEEVAGAPPRPVCRGTLSDGTACRCAEKPGESYCVRGFWGTRYVLEQFVKPGRPPAGPLGPAARCAAVEVLTDGDVEDPPAFHLLERMEEDLGAGVAVTPVGGDVVADLWTPGRRPVVLVVLGHLEERDLPGEPKGPRIQLAGGKFLTLKAVRDKFMAELAWEGAPRALVLLMACGSAGADLKDLNDFTIAFWDAGAAAVVGTECIAFSGLLARFARELTGTMWRSGLPFGQAVREVHQRLLAQGNPLGFVFTSLGDADLVIAKE